MYTDNVLLDSHCQYSFPMSLTPAATAASTAVEQFFPLSAVGLTLRPTDCVDVVAVSGSGNATFVAGARVDTSNNLVLKIANPTAGALTHAAGVFVVVVTRV